MRRSLGLTFGIWFTAGLCAGCVANENKSEKAAAASASPPSVAQDEEGDQEVAAATASPDMAKDRKAPRKKEMQPESAMAKPPAANDPGDLGRIGHGSGTGNGQGFGAGGKLGEKGVGEAGGGKSDGSRGLGTIGGFPGTTTPTKARDELPPPDAAIDPNGRFATTYRPGGGHLAAFESAVARGIIPQTDRELVSDLGARYRVASPKPTDRAIGFQTDLERAELAPSGGPVHVRFTLQSTEKAAEERPHLSVVVVLDVSGSMRGELIQSARQATSTLVDKLRPGDDFSLVTFSTDAEVKIPLTSIGNDRSAIKRQIDAVKEGGGTNISAGLGLGYAQAHDKKIPSDAVRVVLLLSDGRANAGITKSNDLSKLALDAFQDGIQTSSFGLGVDYDGPLMSAIANDGAGGYYYLRDPQQIAPALSTELDKRLDPVATAVEVRVRLKPGVDLLNVYGSRRLNELEASRVRTQEVASDEQAAKRDKIKKDRQEDLQGGMRFFIPAFARDDNHSILLKLRVPEGVGAKDLAQIEVKYKDRITKKNFSDEFPIKVKYADSDAASAKSTNMSVARAVQGFAAGETLMRAGRLIQTGDRAEAARLLAEREGILHFAALSLGEPLFVTDAERLARLRFHSGDQSTSSDPLVLSMMMETAGNVHLR